MGARQADRRGTRLGQHDGTVEVAVVEGQRAHQRHGFKVEGAGDPRAAKAQRPGLPRGAAGLVGVGVGEQVGEYLGAHAAFGAPLVAGGWVVQSGGSAAQVDQGAGVDGGPQALFGFGQLAVGRAHGAVLFGGPMVEVSIAAKAAVVRNGLARLGRCLTACGLAGPCVPAPCPPSKRAGSAD